MKKLLTVSFVCVMVLILIACSAKESDTMNENTETLSMEAEPTYAPTATLAPAPTTAPTTAPIPTAVPTPTPIPTPVVEEIDYTGKKLVALTFDDGPNLNITPLVLDKLEEEGVVASFFLIGKYITESTKPVMERELELGCEIANHSWSHSYMNQLTPEEIKKEIQDTTELIYEMVGVTPAFFRPPYIATNADMYANIDLPFINGINCTDWDGAVTAQKRVETILNNVKDGDIILLHDFDGNHNTVEALDEIIQGLQEDGYALVTVSKLFELKGVEPNQENKIWTNTSW